jgi:hypothetical protein
MAAVSLTIDGSGPGRVQPFQEHGRLELERTGPAPEDLGSNNPLLRQPCIRRNPPSLATISSPKRAGGGRVSTSIDAGDLPP